MAQHKLRGIRGMGVGWWDEPRTDEGGDEYAFNDVSAILLIIFTLLRSVRSFWRREANRKYMVPSSILILFLFEL